MLTEERQKIILEKVNKESVVYLNDLITLLDTSESTIRRDLNALNKAGLLKKVHGGATTIGEVKINTLDEKLELRQGLNIEEKSSIAKYAASFINDNDFVYLDAGTTTELLVNYITAKNVTFVTNGITQAKELIKRGYTTFILGGELKLSTEAIVGVEAIRCLQKYNFTKGFFGVNGVSVERGFTTPDVREALIKEEAISRTKDIFMLADHTKFDEISSATFAEIKKGKIITTKIENTRYSNLDNIIEVEL